MTDIIPTADQRREISEALIAAFPDWPTLSVFTANGMGIQLVSVTSQFFPHFQWVNDLLVWAQARSKIGLLIQTARAFNPDNDLLVQAASKIGIGSTAGHVSRLQSLIDPNHEIQPFATFNSRLGLLEYQVCQIQYQTPGGNNFGTGFLVGPDSVLTCHHVMKHVIDKSVAPEGVTVRFDYNLTPPGTPPRKVREVKLLSAKWLIDHSEPDPVDDTGDESKAPDDNKLDYAVLKLASRVGDEPIMNAQGSPKRGWIKAEAEASVEKDEMLFIVQHPEGKAQGLAFEGPGVKSVNASGTRFRHLVNTKKGSSGAPCFDRDLNLVGLHHSGDTGEHPTWNQAVAIAPIRARIHAQGHVSVLV